MNKSLKTVNWKVFYLSDIFTNYHGKRLVKEQRKNGNIPLLTASESNQGVSDYISKNKNMTKHIDFISIDMFGHAFYHDYNCYGDDNIYFFKNNSISKQAKLFIVVCINKNSSKYSYGNQFRQDNADKDKIILPVNSKGGPDYKFMEEYIKEREAKLKNQYKEQVLKRVKQLQAKINGNGKWGEFRIKDIFPTLVVGKSKGLNHLEQVEQGGIAYLGATNRNNGVLCFVEKVGNEKLIQKGNCVAFIRNGEGSMGYSVYKAENFIATSDITLGYNNKINKYSGMFITTIADRVRGKYSFNYKRSDTRLKKEILSLPVDSKGEPDYEFMHNYMLCIEQKKILEYLEYINE